MNTFRIFLEEQDNPQSIVNIAQQARKDEGITHCSRFGDCNDVCKRTVSLLKNAGINAKLKGCDFQTSEDEELEHSCVIVNGFILDPTIDQFFSALDEDMYTEVPGIYYSHPDWDGDKYVERYHI